MIDPEKVRTTLQTELASVLSRHEKIDGHLKNANREMPKDWSEAAQVVENDEVLEGLDDHARAEITAIRSALQRLDAGTYTKCSKCGEEIGEKRLAALPMAATCVGCAA